MISVLTVDFHSGIFRDIQRASLEQYAHPDVPYELLIQDNGHERNIGHAKGLEKLIPQAKHNTILVLDIDAHVLLPNWNLELMKLKEEAWGKGYRLIAGEGGQLKPVRPCVMLFERDYFLENQCTFQAITIQGAKFDVGILFYYQVLSKGGKVAFFKYGKGSYKNCIGNNYMLHKQPFVYHHWYGTRWYNAKGKRVRDQVDSLTYDKFHTSVNNMVEQWEVL